MTIAVLAGAGGADARLRHHAAWTTHGRVTGFVEKPQTAERARAVPHPGRVDRAPRHPVPRPAVPRQHGHLPVQDATCCSTCSTPRRWRPTSARRSSRAASKTHHVQAHLFDGYWEDLGTIKCYHEANLALAATNPPFDFHSRDGVIYTRMRYLPPRRINGAMLEHCLVSDGCVIGTGSRIERSLIGVRSRIGRTA